MRGAGKRIRQEAKFSLAWAGCMWGSPGGGSGCAEEHVVYVDKFGLAWWGPYDSERVSTLGIQMQF